MKNAILFLILFGTGMVSSPDVVAQKKTTKFQEVSEIPEGQAVIYFYRKSGYGFAIHYSINVDDVPISPVHLYNGGYLVYFADPGKREISSQVADEKSQIVLDIEPGESYFVEGSVRTGTWVGRPYLEEVTRDKAIKKISKCKLLVEK
jgi:hypothetical protein